ELDREWDQICSYPETNPVVEISDENIAYLIYTSGSTGKPKGVALTQVGVTNLAYAQRLIFGPLVGKVVLQFSSFGFDAATWDVVMALSAGAKLVLGDPETVLIGDGLRELIEREQIDVATIPPSVLASVTEIERGKLGTLVVAGEVCPEELVRQW